MPRGLEFTNGFLISKSKRMKSIYQRIEMVSKTNATVLVEGETGTGKELVASAIHNKSKRFGNSFCRVNCAALSETLLESELFGHKKGAFTGALEDKKGVFELANGGSLLLDEIGNLSLFGQAKLLRVLQERELFPVGGTNPIQFDVRVIVTTNIFLGDAVKKGEFREDLYYRLKVFYITMPPLREIKEDIPQLADYFLKEYARQYRKDVKHISKKTTEYLIEHNWPGNIRELKNVMEQSVVSANTDTIQPHHLPTELFSPPAKAETEVPQAENFNLKHRTNLLERQLIVRALDKTNWKKKAACELLGVDQRNLGYFIKKHQIVDPITRLKRRVPETSFSSQDS